MKTTLQVKIIGIVFVISFFIFSIVSFIQFKNYTDNFTDSFIDRSKAIAKSFDVSIGTKEDFQDEEQILLYIQKQIWLYPDITEINVHSFRANLSPAGGGVLTFIVRTGVDQQPRY